VHHSGGASGAATLKVTSGISGSGTKPAVSGTAGSSSHTASKSSSSGDRRDKETAPGSKSNQSLKNGPSKSPTRERQHSETPTPSTKPASKGGGELSASRGEVREETVTRGHVEPHVHEPPAPELKIYTTLDDLKLLEGITLPDGHGWDKNGVRMMVLNRKDMGDQPEGIDKRDFERAVKGGCIPPVDVPSKAASCAVVGNSGAMLTEEYGDAIDRAEVVIRYNNAPVVGYEKHVGHRTQYRMMDPISAFELGRTSNLPTSVLPSKLVFYGKNSGRSYASTCSQHTKFPVYLMSGEAQSAVWTIYEKLLALVHCPKKGDCDIMDQVMARLPGSLEGVFFGLGLCDKVTVYGMEAPDARTKYHYYSNAQSDKDEQLALKLQAEVIQVLKLSRRVLMCNTANDSPCCAVPEACEDNLDMSR